MGSLCEKENLFPLFFETLIPHHLTTGRKDLSPRIQEFPPSLFPFCSVGRERNATGCCIARNQRTHGSQFFFLPGISNFRFGLEKSL